MASRKTYFGLGWPKDPTDPSDVSPTPDAPDAADHSSPTVVDDEKVAEGLKQLRSWYQGDAQNDPARAAAPPPAAAPDLPYARPTAVGHATGAAPPASQRPIAPDPMRATMFGHDIHRFDFDTTPGGGTEPPPSSPAPDPTLRQSERPQVDTPRPQVDTPRPQVNTPPPPGEAVPRNVGGSSQSGSAQLADYLRRQADRPQVMGAFRIASLDDTDAHPAPRVPLSARIILVAGIAALTVAVLLSIQSRSGRETSGVPGAQARPPSSIGIEHARPPETAPPVDPVRAIELQPSAREFPPLPQPVVAPKPAHPIAAPATLKTARHSHAAKSDQAAPAEEDADPSAAEAKPPVPPPPPVEKAALEKPAATPEPAAAEPEQPSAPAERPSPPPPTRKRTESTAKKRVPSDADGILPPSLD